MNRMNGPDGRKGPHPMPGTWITTRAWLLMLPLLMVMIAVIGWPLVDTVRLSFTDAKLVGTAGGFVGLDNYAKMLGGSNFRRALITTTWFAVVSVAAEMVLGVLAALLLNQQFRGRTALRALMILPWALPTVVNATLWRLIYNPEYGALNAALTQIGLIDSYRSWLGEPGLALTALIVADCWKNFPLVALIALAALQAVPRDITAAALVDGAGPVNRFRYVIMPYLAGPLLVALVLRTIEAFKVFDIIWVMTRGGPANSTRTLSILVYQEAFSFQRAGSGASLALIVTLLVTLLAVAYAALLRKAAGAS
ncbi:multiple sugar transport system permease protein [Ensifer mexicanus]|nr:multiple sugar transport system permease protein [Sinorhizobium mexicanum]